MSAIPQTASAKPEENQIVNPSTLEFRRSIKDIDQVFSICKRLIEDNKERNAKAAAIMRKYNDEQPWSAEKLKAAGQGWRHNRSTGFMSSMVKRIMPPYIQAIDSARILTNAMLKDSSQKSEQKNEDFRVEITKTIRRWKNWDNFKSQLVLENCLFGYTAACWTDEYEWSPIFCRQDEAYFPEGCPQDAKETPLFMKIQNFLIHELARKLEEPDIAEAAGWNVKNLCLSINAAMPENRMQGTTEDERKYQDVIRESTMGKSYSEGVKVVKAYHFFIQEYTGRVSHFIIDGKTGKELMTKLDRFESMEECLALFAIEVGNGKLHGSKGAGRVLYNTHVGIEQSRNLIADHLYLSSLILVKATNKGKNSIAIKVQHPVAVLSEDYEVVDLKWEINTEAFFALDRHMSQIAELQVGAFMPGQLLDSGGEKRTASEINYVASIEKQIREGLLARFWGHVMAMVYVMQKRLCSQENILDAMKIHRDEVNKIKIVSKKMWGFLSTIGKIISGKPQVNFKLEEENYGSKDGVYLCLCLLRKKLTAEEIYELANCPPNEVTQDMASQMGEAIETVSVKYLNNPRVKQTELIKKDIASKLGNSIADELVIPEEDQTTEAEATRMQLLEFQILMQGDYVPVSPRDIDEIHLRTIKAKAMPLIATITPDAVTPDTVKIAENVLAHIDEHIQSAIVKGMSADALAEPQELSKQFHGILDQVKQLMGQAPQNTPLPEGVAPAAVDVAAPPVLSGMDGAPQAPEVLPAVPIPPSAPGGMPLSRGPTNL